MALTLAVSVAACQRKHLEVKDMSQLSKGQREVVVKTITLQNLEERVTKLENRLDAAKAARARRTVPVAPVIPKGLVASPKFIVQQ